MMLKGLQYLKVNFNLEAETIKELTTDANLEKIELESSTLQRGNKGVYLS